MQLFPAKESAWGSQTAEQLLPSWNNVQSRGYELRMGLSFAALWKQEAVRSQLLMYNFEPQGIWHYLWILIFFFNPQAFPVAYVLTPKQASQTPCNGIKSPPALLLAAWFLSMLLQMTSCHGEGRYYPRSLFWEQELTFPPLWGRQGPKTMVPNVL